MTNGSNYVSAPTPFSRASADVVCSWESGSFDMGNSKYVQLFTLLWKMPDGSLFMTKERVNEVVRDVDGYPGLSFVRKSDDDDVMPIDEAVAVQNILMNATEGDAIVMANFSDFVKENNLEGYLKSLRN